MIHFTPGPGAVALGATGEPFAGLRPLGPQDGAAFDDHLRRLDGRARRLRFGTAVNDAFLTTYAQRASTGGVARIGLFEAGILRGVAELHPVEDAPDTAEAALSLETPFRRLGHGTRLFAALLEEARGRGIARMTLHCLRENHAMRRLAARFAGEIGLEAGEITATLRV